MSAIEYILEVAAAWIWGAPLLVLITISGLYFLVSSSFLPFRHFFHALGVLSGRYDKVGDPGQVSHFQALSVALAATIGMGNIAGVAIAVRWGGPGVIFWMWISAIIGVATKFFTCSLAVMYRGRDSAGELQGGPMYVITEGLGRNWKPLAVFFCVAGMFGCLPVFNANQLTQAFREILAPDTSAVSGGYYNLAIGAGLAGLTAFVILGGLKRIANAAAMIVPFMVGVYFVAVVGIVILNAEKIPYYFSLILTDAFRAEYYNGDAMLGGALGALIVLGLRRAAFSNEAGIGTAPMAHGAAKTSEPVHEGLVAMLGPIIDTLIVCTMTAMAILMTDVWRSTDVSGVSLTAAAFQVAYPGVGKFILLGCILSFGLSSLFSYSYFGAKCFSFLFGVKRIKTYLIFYILSIIVGAVSSMTAIINFIDLMFALMAGPTLISALLLSPKVVSESKRYFAERKFQKKSSVTAGV